MEKGKIDFEEKRLTSEGAQFYIENKTLQAQLSALTAERDRLKGVLEAIKNHKARPSNDESDIISDYCDLRRMAREALKEKE